MIEILLNLQLLGPFLLLICLILPLLFFFSSSPFKNKEAVPTKKFVTIPKSYPLIGSYFALKRIGNRRIQWLSDLVRISPAATFTFHRPLGRLQVFTGNPATVEHILKTRFSNYQKGYSFISALSDFLGTGIFNANGNTWKFQRQVASHEFNTKSLRKFVEQVVDAELSDRLLPSWLRPQNKTGPLISKTYSNASRSITSAKSPLASTQNIWHRRLKGASSRWRTKKRQR